MTDFDSPVQGHPVPVAWRFCQCFLYAAGLCLYVTAAYGADTSQSATGIPIEWLFGVIGILVGIIYLDLKREVRSLSRDATGRANQIFRITLDVRDIKRKLQIQHREDDDREQ